MNSPMNNEMESLKFFGKVNASISHELKNIFAIISETTGFLDDLTQLAKKGEKFDLSILENCNASIAEEIERGFQVIRRMNRFAHSVDDPLKEIHLASTLELTAKLTGLLSYAKPVKITEPAQDILITTSPFLFQGLIYQILCELYQIPETKEVLIRFDPVADTQIQLIVSNFASSPCDFLSSRDIKGKAAKLNIDLEVSTDPAEISIRVPRSVDL